MFDGVFTLNDIPNIAIVKQVTHLDEMYNDWTILIVYIVEWYKHKWSSISDYKCKMFMISQNQSEMLDHFDSHNLQSLLSVTSRREAVIRIHRERFLAAIGEGKSMSNSLSWYSTKLPL